MIIIHNDITHRRNTGQRISTAVLQKHLKKHIRKNKIKWIKFSNSKKFHATAINWIWGIGGKGDEIIIECENNQVYYIVGPNILFEQAEPVYEHEKIAINSPFCLGYFHYSDWYGDLIKKYLGERAGGELYQYFKPVWPVPKNIKDIKYDLLLFLKHGDDAKRTFENFKQTDFFKNRRVTIFQYGSYKKKELYNAARASRVCLYLSYGESGGIATQEIMACGCPIVSMERDSPLGINKKTVNWVSDKREIKEIIEAIKECETYDRIQVREIALKRFSIDSSVTTVIKHLETINSKIIE